MYSVVEHLPSINKTLDSISSTTHKKKKDVCVCRYSWECSSVVEGFA
jgi:hypothetical protein